MTGPEKSVLHTGNYLPKSASDMLSQPLVFYSHTEKSQRLVFYSHTEIARRHHDSLSEHLCDLDHSPKGQRIAERGPML